jgi:hypothetical protein
MCTQRSSSLTQTSASSAELFTAFKAAHGTTPSTTIKPRREIVDQSKNMVKKHSSSKGKDDGSPLSRGGSPLSLAAWAARTNHKIKFADAIKALDDNRTQTELLALFKQNVDQGFVRIVQPVPHTERHCESTAVQHRWAKGSDGGGGCETSIKKLRSESISVKG